ncbi:hypothetical protein [Noviherbaspirillum sp. UKPF54]|uniref:hypothetical protein n=1 Tax=Noviherbaspirillum sp. UKPF54 TaxID=2601898 RepID=UPI0011B1749F|nr:hypothetical protein [Noviherbaspirillum sp. UKPF54]QDZ28071.1 hypothetical protein FAY22_09000 [Noviherbaspirillum sp. UKPF54]
MPDLSFVLPLFLQSALLPLVAALAVLAALRNVRNLRASGAAAALALAAGFLASYFAVFHEQWSPAPHQALDWMPWIVVFGAAGALGAQLAGQATVRIALRVALSLAAAFVVAWPAAAGMGMVKILAAIAAGGLLMAAAWNYLSRASTSRPTPVLLLMVVAGGAALTLMFDSSQAIGQLSGALASALAAVAVCNMPRMRVPFGGAAAGVAVLALGSLLLNAYIYSGLPLGYVALLAGALLADPLVAAFDRARQRNASFASHAGAAVLSALPVLVTIALAVKTAQESGGY